MKEFRCILSLKLARYLLAQGYSIADIDTSKKISGKLVFIFKNSPELNKAILNYQKGEENAIETTNQKHPNSDNSQAE
jgi:hypothetical protein